MNATNIVRDGKWYLLLFEEYARFLVEKTNYDIYMISYDKPMIKVNQDNFEKLNKNVNKFREKRTQGDCFVMELELPPMKIEIIHDNKPRVNFNSHFYTGLQGYVLDLPDGWKHKVIEDQWKKEGREFDLDKTRNELDEKIVKYNNGEL